MLKRLLATKSIHQFHIVAKANALQRTLGPLALIQLGIGAIIGTGIFVLTGTAAANHAGPALALSFVVAGIGCAFAGLSYAEFAAMIPVAGGAYSYAYATLGEGIAWFIGWNLVLEYLVAAATVAVGWSGYVMNLLGPLGLHLPPALTQAPLDRLPGHGGIVRTGALINLPAILIVAAASVVCYVGMRRSSALNTLIVSIKLGVVVVFILLGAQLIDPGNWHPFIPPNHGTLGEFGWSGVLTASGVIFFAYIGFDAISVAAQEARAPQRDMPIAILVSLGVCTLLYIATSLVLTGMVPYTDLDVAAPVALALDRHPTLAWFALPVKIGAIAGMTSVILVMLLGQPRIFYAMAQDGLLPPAFARVHPRYRTPSTGTVVTGTAAAAIAGIFPVRVLGELVSIGTLVAFVAVCAGVLVLRYVRPDLERPFRAPLPWLTCPAGIITCGVMIVMLPSDTWIRLGVWTLAGLMIYVGYGYRHSRIGHFIAELTQDPPGPARESSTARPGQ